MSVRFSKADRVYLTMDNLLNDQEDFRKYLVEANAFKVKELLKKESIDINFIYKKENFEELNALQLICTAIIDKREDDLDSYLKEYKQKFFDCFKQVIESDIDLNYKDPDYNTNVIDFTVLTGDSDIVRLTIDKYKEKLIPIRNIDLITSVINYHINEQDVEQDYLDVIELVLQNGVDVNTLDVDTGEPPIYLAARLKFKEVIEVLCRNKLREIDFDNFVDSKGKSARDLILKYTLHSEPLPEREQCKFYLLYKHLKDKNVTKFIECYKKEATRMSDEKRHSFLIRAVQLGAEEIVEYMIKETKSTFDDYNSLYQIACRKGFYKVIAVLLDDAPSSYNHKLVRSLVRIEIGIEDKTKFVDYNECLSLILSKRPDIDLNSNDKFGKTVLQYAIKLKHLKMVTTLLNNGASLMTHHKKALDQCLVLDIDPQKIEAHFDNCMTYNQDEQERTWMRKGGSRSNRDKCDYKINFTSVLPPRKKIKDATELYLPEITVFTQIAREPDYRPLLGHPLAAAFVAMKWHRIRKLFYFDVFLYVLFTATLITYILTEHLMVVNFFSYCVVVGWECIQSIIFGRKYFISGDSWFKMGVLAVTSIIYLMEGMSIMSWADGEQIKVQLHASVALIALINFFFIIGHFPTLSTSVIMIKTVYITLCKAFITYSILIIAFSISFYILFVNNTDKLYSNILKSFFRTIMMSNGEYNTPSLGLDNYPVVSYAIVGLFTFLISIGLFNLLTGLAVSDIQNIKTNAELFDQVIRIGQVARMERIFLKPMLIRYLPFLKSICLFATGAEAKVEIDSSEKEVNILWCGDKLPIGEKILSIIETRKKKFKEDEK